MSTPQAASLLSPAQLSSFVQRGYLALPVRELDADFHHSLYEAAVESSLRRPQEDTSFKSGGTQARDEERLPLTASAVDGALPAVGTLLDSSTVRGALTGILGEGYFRHPHSTITVDPDPADELVGSEGPYLADQGWHRDSYAGVQRMRHHRPRWVFCERTPVHHHHPQPNVGRLRRHVLPRCGRAQHGPYDRRGRHALPFCRRGRRRGAGRPRQRHPPR